MAQVTTKQVTAEFGSTKTGPKDRKATVTVESGKLIDDVYFPRCQHVGAKYHRETGHLLGDGPRQCGIYGSDKMALGLDGKQGERCIIHTPKETRQPGYRWADGFLHNRPEAGRVSKSTSGQAGSNEMAELKAQMAELTAALAVLVGNGKGKVAA